MSELGLEKGVVRLVPHNPQWKKVFEQEKERLNEAIGQYVLDIQHIGSTAVEGIHTKPIVDIGVAVESFEGAFVCVEPLTALGYVYHGENGVPRRHYFDYGSPCTLHLHIFEFASDQWQAHILFRDYLIRHPEAAARYEALKIRLAEQYRTDREKYTDSKGELILGIIEQAKEEQRQSNGDT